MKEKDKPREKPKEKPRGRVRYLSHVRQLKKFRDLV